jgi:putative transposase
MTCLRLCRNLMQLVGTVLVLLGDSGRFLGLCLRSHAALAAANLFLRQPLALYQERHGKPRRATDAARLALVCLGRWFDWRQVVAVVQSATFIRWHRQGFQLLWRWQSTPGRPPIPLDLQTLIRHMARENPTWGQERIANKLLLKRCMDLATAA